MAIEAAKLMVVIGADGAMEVTQQLGLMGQLSRARPQRAKSWQGA